MVSDKKWVVQVFPYDPSNSNRRPGGGISYVHQLTIGLVESGFRVMLFGTRWGPKSFRHPRFKHIPVSRARSGFYWINYFIALSLRVPFVKIPANTIIHVHHPFFLLPFILFKPKHPRICFIHGPSFVFTRRWFRWAYASLRRVERWCLRRATVIGVCNLHEKSLYSAQFPEVADRITVSVITGVNLELFKPVNKIEARRRFKLPTEAGYIVFAGRLSEEEKNLVFLLHSYSSLKAKVPQAKLVLLGDGPDRSNLENLVQTMGLEDVHFLGALPRAEVPWVFNCADVFVLPSRHEGAATVLREALACGLPVVATNVGDARLVINSELIGTVVENDIHAFAKAIEMFLLTSKDVETISSACRARASEFGIQHTVELVTNIYANL